jgi:hypothetical protein
MERLVVYESMEGMELVNFTVLSWYPALETGNQRQPFMRRIYPVVIYYIKIAVRIAVNQDKFC